MRLDKFFWTSNTEIFSGSSSGEDGLALLWNLGRCRGLGIIIFEVPSVVVVARIAGLTMFCATTLRFLGTIMDGTAAVVIEGGSDVWFLPE